MTVQARLLAAAAASAIALMAARAAAAGTTCEVDGKPWVVQPVTGRVATKPAFGKMVFPTLVTFNLWDEGKTRLPYLQFSAQWKRLAGKRNVTIKGVNAKPDDPLEAMWTEVAATQPPVPGEPQPGLHYLEKGELKLIKHDAAAGTLTLNVSLTLREGSAYRAADNGGKHKVDVRCTLDAVPIKIL